MNRPTDQQLLRDYAGRRSETAFAELVQRHVDLVYSAALRILRDAHLAEDVTQGVFLALAQSASQLADHPVLSGWLHRTAQNLAAKIVRTDVRRRAREREAVAMTEMLSTEPDIHWEQIAPHLDAALGELNEQERDALLLRYFERKSAHEMAETLGVSDEAAQKRVSRAVDRLRELFAKRGLSVGAGGLAAALTANAVQAAPAGMAVAITSAAALTGTTVATSIISTATKAIAMTTLQKAIVAVIVAASVTTPLVIQHQHQIQLRDENRALRQQVDQMAQLQTENDHLSNLLAQASADRSSYNDQLKELVRLRGEVERLREATNAIVQLQEENRKLRPQSAGQPNSSTAKSPPNVPPQDIFPRESWTAAGYANPRSAFQTAVLAITKGDADAYASSVSPELLQAKQKEVADTMQLTGKSLADLEADTAQQYSAVTGYRIVDEKTVSDDQVILSVYLDGVGVQKAVRMKKIGDEWKLDAAP